MSLSDTQIEFFRSDFGDFWPFLEKVDFVRDPLLLEMEKEFAERQIYSVGPWFGRLLSFLVRFGQVSSAVEFGTGNGYSAVWIARGLAQGGCLHTLEIDPELAQLAQTNVERAGLCKSVVLLVGDATETIKAVKGPVDFMFVDCAHSTALRSAEHVLRTGGLFVCDNVGFSNKDQFNADLTSCPYLESLYLHCYLKGRIPENQAFSISMKT
jgi:predicted O-methyltransferase YrrM